MRRLISIAAIGVVVVTAGCCFVPAPIGLDHDDHERGPPHHEEHEHGHDRWEHHGPNAESTDPAPDARDASDTRDETN